VKSLVPVFYAHQNTRFPVRCAAISMLANIVLALALMGPMRLGGLALATALASYLNVVLLYRGIPRRLPLQHPPGLFQAAVRFLIAGGVCAVVAIVINRSLSVPALPRFLIAGIAGLAANLVVLLFMRSEEPRDLLELLGARFRRAR
jgi:putative peptidoglycan lipid II flippase